VHHRDCKRVSHEDYDHIWICKEHRTIGCDCCHTQIEMEDEEYWSNNGLKKFCARHAKCREGTFRSELSMLLTEIMNSHHIHIGLSMFQQIDDKKVLCLIHESEPVHASSEGADDSDDVACLVLSIADASKTLDLNTQEILAMEENCPYVILAVDGMRIIRELGWNEIAEIWQKNIELISAEISRVRGYMN